jgi:hypothetical protein
MTADTGKTLVTPEIAKNIHDDFVCLIDLWVKRIQQSKMLDEMAIERLGLTPSDLHKAKLSSASKETEDAESTRDTLVFLLSLFEQSVDSGVLYLEDELEIYEYHLLYRQEHASEYTGILRGYVEAQDIFKAYL